MPEFFWVRWLQESSLRAYLDCILLPRRRSGAAVIGLESVPSGHQGYRLSLFFDWIKAASIKIYGKIKKFLTPSYRLFNSAPLRLFLFCEIYVATF
jgi:hypothetical protein